MTIWSTIVKRFVAPALPKPTQDYDKTYFENLVNILRLYFNQLDNLLGQIVATTGTAVPVSIGGTNVDAFGRVRSSSPYTLFDSQNRYAKNDLWSESTVTGGSVSYDANASTVELNVTATLGSEVVRQTFRSFSYQPGKGLLNLNTFVFGTARSGIRMRVGYFNTQNGVFLERADSTVSFVRRTYVTGSPVDNSVTQANWNGDKLDGTGDSGYTLDLTKAQIMWMDFEWLGVGTVRCGFVIDGQFIICHTFNNANNLSSVYMTTAILPVRYEITNTGGVVGSASTLKQICSSVISEGGYEKKVAATVVRVTTAKTANTATLTPLISLRLASGRTGAVVIPDGYSVLCSTVPADYELLLLKNPTFSVAPATWSATGSANVESSTDGTLTDPPTASTVVHSQFTSGSNQAGGATFANGEYNWNLQLGATISGTSDIYTLAVRPISGNEDFYSSLSFWDLT